MANQAHITCVSLLYRPTPAQDLLARLEADLDDVLDYAELDRDVVFSTFLPRLADAWDTASVEAYDRPDYDREFYPALIDMPNPWRDAMERRQGTPTYNTH